MDAGHLARIGPLLSTVANYEILSTIELD